MKNSLIPLSVLACLSGVASAQDSITWYGIADAGLSYVTQSAPTGATSATGNAIGVESGLLQASRFGVRGSQDIGKGLSSTFALEGGLSFDTGTSSNNAVFARRTVVGLTGPNFGNLEVGRRKDFTDEVAGAYSSITPFGTFVTRVHANNLDRVGGNRANNMLYYSTPVFSGFRANMTLGFGETSDNSQAGRSLGYGALYDAGGPLSVGFGYWTSKLGAVTATANSSSDQGSTAGAGCNTVGLGREGDTCITTWMLGARYKIDSFSLRGTYSEVSQPLITASGGLAPNFTTAFLRTAGAGAFTAGGSNNTGSKVVDVGVDYSTGPWKLKASYIQSSYDFVGASTQGKLKQYLVGAEYTMHKTTTLYGTLSSMTAEDMYSPGILGNAPGGANTTTALGLGIRRTF